MEGNYYCDIISIAQDLKLNYKEPVVHFNKILSIRVNFTNKKSEIRIENRSFGI